jgi:iron complex outermembrane receptor protein
MDSFTVQAFIDFTRRDWPAHMIEKRLTADIDFQYNLRSLPRNDLIFGFGVRQGDDEFAPATRGIPSDSLQLVQHQMGGGVQRLISVFGQDDITLVPGKLTLTLGTKLEHQNDTGSELSPNLRLLLTPNEDWSLWSAVSKAVRTPSRVDRRGQVVASVELPDGFVSPQPEVLRGFNQFGSPLPILLQQGSGRVDSERVIAFELGVKHRVSETLSIDLAAFHNDYEHLRTARLVPPTCAPSGGEAPACLLLAAPGTVTHLVENSPVGNGTSGYGRGAELSVDWLPSGRLRLQGALSLFKTSTIADYSAGEFETDRDSGSPRRQWSLNAFWNAGRNAELTLGLRRVGDVSPAIGIYLSGYTELDARLAWRPRENMELSLQGRNLLHARHQEYASELQEVALTAMQRSLFGQISLRF